MSTGYIRADLRKLVATRADHLCEYCLIHSEDTFFGCEIDHVISEKHGGVTHEDNLAYACPFCNRKKGSDIASTLPGTNTLVPLFNPRQDRWSDHFRLDADEITILALTPIGEATLRLLGLNDDDHLSEREALRGVNRYPTQAAKKRMDR